MYMLYAYVLLTFNIQKFLLHINNKFYKLIKWLIGKIKISDKKKRKFFNLLRLLHCYCISSSE